MKEALSHLQRNWRAYAAAVGMIFIAGGVYWKIPAQVDEIYKSQKDQYRVLSGVKADVAYIKGSLGLPMTISYQQSSYETKIKKD